MKVIFHGDDFGLTSGINQGIIRAFKHGLLTSTSLMAVGEATEEAMGLALENPGLDVGIHLVLADEPPLLMPTALSTVISSDGLLPSRNRILAAILSRKLDYGQVEAEWSAQVERALKEKNQHQPPGQPPIHSPLSGTFRRMPQNRPTLSHSICEEAL